MRKRIKTPYKSGGTLLEAVYGVECEQTDFSELVGDVVVKGSVILIHKIHEGEVAHEGGRYMGDNGMNKSDGEVGKNEGAQGVENDGLFPMI
jgi:hypothetical protein